MNEVNLAPDLLRLARLYGINLSYWDAGGTRHHLSEQTLRQLLVGFAVLDSVDADEHAIGQAVHRERLALWHAGAPPVAVLRERQSALIELVIPTQAVDRLWRWSIETEVGDHLEDTFTPVQLAPAGDHHDIEGWANAHQTTIDDRALRRFLLPLPELACGYHALNVEPADAGSTCDNSYGSNTRVIVAPARCHLPAQKDNGESELRVWGLALQLYAVRSARNWGIGDFTDLYDTVGVAASLGAHVLGINPLHALSLHEPEQASPYSPSSRLFLNPLYIDVEQVDDFDSLSAAEPASAGLPVAARLDSLRSSDFVDYRSVAQAKLPVLEALFTMFTRNHLNAGTERARDFRRFQTHQGASLRNFTRFEALREVRFSTMGSLAGDWHQWPEPLRDPDSDAVADFAEANRHRIEFHAWLQWLGHEQLDRAAANAKSRGLKVGLYRDLAVGVAIDSSDTWANSPLFANNVQVGAPPDDFSANGQDWGLPPLNPRALRETGYSLFTEILRRNMRAAGALRIDHVMGLMRIFCIPAGEHPSAGTYVDYPIDDLLGIVALESQRQTCIVIGEDLGTVPDGLRERLQAAGVLSYRLLYFEKHYEGDLSFRRPEEYPVHALVGANTHDLPTLRSFWSGSDITLRESLGLFPGESMCEQQLQERARDRERLLDALCNLSLLSPPDVAQYRETGVIDDALVKAIHLYLAHTRSMLLIANLEDLLGQMEQVNLPGTDRDVYPNWRRKLPLALEDWPRHEPLTDCAAAVTEARASRSQH